MFTTYASYFVLAALVMVGATLGLGAQAIPWATRIGIWLVAAVIAVWILSQIRVVSWDGDALTIENLFREVRVPLAEVESVGWVHGWYYGRKFVKLCLRNETELGRRITFHFYRPYVFGRNDAFEDFLAAVAATRAPLTRGRLSSWIWGPEVHLEGETLVIGRLFSDVRVPLSDIDRVDRGALHWYRVVRLRSGRRFRFVPLDELVPYQLAARLPHRQ